MTLNSGANNFYSDVSKTISFLQNKNLDLFDVEDLLQSTNPKDDFLKVYISYSSKGIVAHKSICPDKPELIVGFGYTTKYGFWVGMLRKDQVISAFTSIQDFVNAFGCHMQLSKNSTCKRCKV